MENKKYPHPNHGEQKVSKSWRSTVTLQFYIDKQELAHYCMVEDHIKKYIYYYASICIVIFVVNVDFLIFFRTTGKI